jgi:hypothetical protein
MTTKEQQGIWLEPRLRRRIQRLAKLEGVSFSKFVSDRLKLLYPEYLDGE